MSAYKGHPFYGNQWTDGSRERAEQYIEQAQKAEPTVTDDIKEILAQGSSELIGEEFKIKTQKSLQRKIKSFPNKKMKDILRYTSISSSNDLAKEIVRIQAGLENKGYTVTNIKNTWNNPVNPYNGVNTNIITPEGYEFELQFHTPESFELKNGELHKLYEEFRVLDHDNPKRAELNEKMFSLSNRLTTPPNIDTIRLEKKKV